MLIRRRNKNNALRQSVSCRKRKMRARGSSYATISQLNLFHFRCATPDLHKNFRMGRSLLRVGEALRGISTFRGRPCPRSAKSICGPLKLPTCGRFWRRPRTPSALNPPCFMEFGWKRLSSGMTSRCSANLRINRFLLSVMTDEWRAFTVLHCILVPKCDRSASSKRPN